MVAAPKRLLNVFNGMQHILLRVQHLQNRVEGHEMTTPGQKPLILGNNWHFWAIFGRKKRVFLVGAALKHLFHWFSGMLNIGLRDQHRHHRAGEARTDHPDPENTDLGRKLAFLGHCLVKNVVAAPKKTGVEGSMACSTSHDESSTFKIG